MPKIIVSMDLSLSSPAFAVIQLNDDKTMKLLEVSHIKSSSKELILKRIYNIAKHFNQIMKDNSVDVLVREKGFSHRPATTQKLFRVVGAIDVIAAMHKHYEIIEITPKSVKKTVTGNGNADKLEVAAALEQFVGKQFYANDDESDAVAVAVAYVKEYVQ